MKNDIIQSISLFLDKKTDVTGHVRLSKEDRSDLMKLIRGDSDDSATNFDYFWDNYHKMSGRPKTDRVPAMKYWKKLTPVEKRMAIDNIKPYTSSVDKKFVKKARTYLADKTFYDEFKENKKEIGFNSPIL